MPTREELLKDYTYKSDNSNTEERVFNSIYKKDNQRLSILNTARYLSLLSGKLYEKGLLSEEEIDDLLLETVQ